MRLVVFGLLLACLGSLGAVTLYQRGTTSQPVLVATRTISRGEVIGRNDLRIVDVSVGEGLRFVPAGSQTEVVGQVALVDLADGSPLTPGSYGKAVVAAGMVHIGLRLAAGRLPVRDLPAGTPVRLIGVSTKDGATGENVGTGVVVTSPRATSDGAASVLDIAVRSELAIVVAQLAATDRLVVVREAA